MSRSFELQDLRWPYLELLSTSSLEYPEFLASCLAIQAYCHDSLQYFLPLFKLHSVFFFLVPEKSDQVESKERTFLSMSPIVTEDILPQMSQVEFFSSFMFTPGKPGSRKHITLSLFQVLQQSRKSIKCL